MYEYFMKIVIIIFFFFSFQKTVRHYHIKVDTEKKYYVSHRHHFDSVSKLIEYHKLNSAGKFNYSNMITF